MDCRWFVVDEVCEVDDDLYEIYPISRVFSYLVHSCFEILPGDVVLVEFESYYARVVKLVRDGDDFYDVQS